VCDQAEVHPEWIQGWLPLEGKHSSRTEVAFAEHVINARLPHNRRRLTDWQRLLQMLLQLLL